MAAELNTPVTPVAALILSALALPGLGQLLTGRMARGAIMAGALFLWLPVVVIKLGRDIMLVLPSLTARAEAGEALAFSDLQSALSPLAAGALWLFMPLITIWVWSLVDSIQYVLQSRRG